MALTKALIIDKQCTRILYSDSQSSALTLLPLTLVKELRARMTAEIISSYLGYVIYWLTWLLHQFYLENWSGSFLVLNLYIFHTGLALWWGLIMVGYGSKFVAAAQPFALGSWIVCPAILNTKMIFPYQTHFTSDFWVFRDVKNILWCPCPQHFGKGLAWDLVSSVEVEITPLYFRALSIKWGSVWSL